MRYLHAHHLFSAAFIIAGLAVAVPVEARSDAQAAGTQAAESGTEADSLTTGSIGQSQVEKRKKQFEDCMAIWEPATHMTKKQWRRTCDNSFDELPNL